MLVYDLSGVREGCGWVLLNSGRVLSLVKQLVGLSGVREGCGSVLLNSGLADELSLSLLSNCYGVR